MFYRYTFCDFLYTSVKDDTMFIYSFLVTDNKNGTTQIYVKKCYEPKVCCGIPSTMLTEDGYVLKTPSSPFTYPAPSPFKPTTPVNNQYLPPGRPTFSTSTDQSQPITGITTPRQPQPTVTDRQPQPSRTPTQSTTKEQRTTSKPQGSTRATTTKPLPSVTKTSVPSTTPPKYLPPTYSVQQGGNEINERDRDVQPTNQQKVVIRGEAQLSPQIFPTKKFGDQFGTTPAVKCASALVCTAENYCNSIGVISETPVELSSFRVPLTDCIIESTGASGKCCRDPNYVDPWPVNLAGVCAQRNTNTKPRGVRDIDASFAEIAWQAMILKESTKMLLCGGAIIGDAVVLTTASCVRNEAVNDVRVKAGEWELGSTNEPLPFQLVSVKAIEIHPNYDANTGSNDMAVLHLSERLQFATHIQPICISDKDPSSSETCITTGWGKQALSIHEEGAIMHVTVTNPVSRSECGADDSGVCSTTKFDSCQFDAGSALACGTGSNVQLKGIYGVENSCGEGEAVRFIKPDVAWVNKQFMERSKPLLLRS
uniref:Lectizyme n=1 Tax=Glossina brevipalpis TaxID=37001 RepID=A0A1A9WYS8_9MUSC